MVVEDTLGRFRVPPQTHEASGGEGEWQQSSSSLQHWVRGSVRKSEKYELVAPCEQQLGWKTPRGTTGCELSQSREVEKEEMLPGTCWGTHHVMASARGICAVPAMAPVTAGGHQGLESLGPSLGWGGSCSALCIPPGTKPTGT